VSRLVAVLGYSDGSDGLHPVCRARLQRAAEVTTATDVVLLSGWARHPWHDSEAELMARAWKGPASDVLLDDDARSTLGNVVGAVRASVALEARELVLVTSSWHARRTAALLKAAARGTGVHVDIAPTRERGSRRAKLREIACWALVPLQASLARRRR
jgi:vancomycin permeability regulator SanA